MHDNASHDPSSQDTPAMCLGFTPDASDSDPHRDAVSPFLAPDPQSISYSGPASHTADGHASSASSQPFHAVLPSPGALSEPSLSSESPFHSHSEPLKRRPLPSTSSLSSCSSETVPSSPLPPYSRPLPSDEPRPMSRDLSRVSSVSHPTLAPEAPVILPPQPDDPTDHPRATYDTFLCHSPPTNTWIVVETSASEYTLRVCLPGFRRDGITIATRRRRILHVVADSWEPEGGHFERRVSFGYDAELAQVRAEFDGEMLRIVIPRRIPLVSS